MTYDFFFFPNRYWPTSCFPVHYWPGSSIVPAVSISGHGANIIWLIPKKKEEEEILLLLLAAARSRY